MSFLDGLWHRVHVLLRGESYAREVERELRFHADLETLSQSGRPIGNETYYREEVRRMTLLDVIDRVRQDLGYAVRGLRRSPGFTATIVLILGLGIGVNAAMYSFLDRVFVRSPGGLPAPHEVRRVYSYSPNRTSISGGRFITESFAYPQYAAMREALGSRPLIAAFTEPESVSVRTTERGSFASHRSYVTASYFGALSLRAQRGRLFGADEDQIETPTPAAVISDALWRSHFGADPSVIGRHITIKKQQYSVVGVAPPEFGGITLSRTDIWVPVNTFPGTARGDRPWYMGRGSYFRLVAHTPTPIDEERLKAIGTPTNRRGWQVAYGPPDSTSLLLTGPTSVALGPMARPQEISVAIRLGIVALTVLAIACANVATLLIVRSLKRRREIAVRRALGGSAGRIYAQVLTESVLLSVIGGLVAVVISVWAARALRALLLPQVRWADGAVDLRVIAVAGAMAVAVGVLAGLAPALHATGVDLVTSLKAGSRQRAVRPSRIRSALLVAQAALSVVLVVGATLVTRSLRNVESIDIGYDPAGLVYASPFYEPTDRVSGPDVTAAVVAAAREVESLPGVRSVSVAQAAPMRGSGGWPMFLPGRENIPRFPGNDFGPFGNAISPTYFTTVGLKLLAGRGLAESDRRIGDPIPTTVVVGATLARAFWPGESALGKCIVLGKRTNGCVTVVGVVADGREFRVLDAPPMQYYYLTSTADTHTLIVRTAPGKADAMKEPIRRAMAAALPGEPYVRVAQMTDDLEPDFRPWRLGARLFVAMGLLAAIVAAIGIYSVVAHSVSQRTNEMGVRIALGAQMSDILDLVVGEGLRTVAIGVILGIAASLVVGPLMASLLFGVTPRDLSALIIAVVTLCGIGLVASLIPAWRATRVDPVASLRAE